MVAVVGYLVDHGIYLVVLTACDVRGECGNATLTLYASPGVGLCSLALPSYTAYTWVEAEVEGCSVPAGRAPLTYQLVLTSGGKTVHLTPPLPSPLLAFVGPPSPTGTISLAPQVCDRYSQCTIFPSKTVSVANVSTPEAERAILRRAAARAFESGDPLLAMSLALPLTLTEKNVEDGEAILEYAAEAIFERPLTSGQLALLFSAVEPLLEDETLQGRALTAMEKATVRASAFKLPASTASIQQAHAMLAELPAGRQARSALTARVAAALPLGQRLELGERSASRPVTLLFHTMLDGKPVVAHALSAAHGPVKAGLELGERLRLELRVVRYCRFRRWDCRQPEPCRGVVVVITIYPERGPQGPHSTALLTPVVDVSLRAPNTGDTVPVKDVPDEVVLSFTKTGNATQDSSKSIRCLYWDEQTEAWSVTGVSFFGIVERTARCRASHLSMFAVLEMDDGFSTAALAGIIVASTMSILIICAVLMFVMRKKQTKEVRVSHETLRANNHSNSHHNHHHNHTEPKKPLPKN
ncbi:hypothetical protein LAZ67_17001330 [Cordylochernes scorpioides]|uniref:GPS domain-containing protein n=1 Tax=Cordylochernes scorpioides TaxID=51811 RepID=A0ABY6LDC6_9ARAC|nr:hypothetical protein LAZ67_17001330 [Cordylochernes scorpioides]